MEACVNIVECEYVLVKENISIRVLTMYIKLIAKFFLQFVKFSF